MSIHVEVGGGGATSTDPETEEGAQISHVIGDELPSGDLEIYNGTGNSEILQHIKRLEKRLHAIESFRSLRITYDKENSDGGSTRSGSPVSPIPNYSRDTRYPPPLVYIRPRSPPNYIRPRSPPNYIRHRSPPNYIRPRSPPPQSTGETPNTKSDPKIIYTIEYTKLNKYGQDEVFETEAGEKPRPRTQNGDYESDFERGPALEVIRRIRVSNPRRFTGLEKRPTVLMINSPYLIDALARMTDDPSVLEVLKRSDRVMIREPYQLVVYCLDGLRNYEANHAEEEDLAITLSHISLLLDFISASIGGALEEEKKLNCQEIPLVTWDWLWTIFRPGQKMVASTEAKKPSAYVITRITGYNLSNPVEMSQPYSSPYTETQPRAPEPQGGSGSYRITCWSLVFDGNNYQKRSSSFFIPRFSGPKQITSLPVYPLTIPGIWSDNSLSKALLERGRRIYETHKTSPSHREYHGWTLDPQPSEIQSRVVIDHECYYQGRRLRTRPHDAYQDLDNNSDYTSHATIASGETPLRNQQDVESWDGLNMGYIHSTGRNTALANHETILITNEVFGWILKDRKWALLDIDYVTDIIPDKHIFDSLILPEDRTEIIKALVQSHKRRELAVPGQQYSISEDMTYSADVVKGKGQGLLILLHGPPGVGKTSTAECVAEYTERPLFPITCGDLGTKPKMLEEKLQEAFRLAQRWGAVLLLDEADVFLGRRELNDINRNSLVSVFLRVLEYYTGILFLTSNRVGSFDEAFTSRLHVSIHYPRLEEKERSRIWKYHVERLERIREDLDVKDSVNDYLENNQELKKIMFNGRQIRNIFQTAVSLALYEAKVDQKRKGRPSLRSDHLKKVIKLSCEFQEYLKSTRESDSDKALDGELRNDTFSK